MVYGVGDFARDAEQRIVGDVAAGTYDLGVVGTRVFDTLGINSFQALTAPMLIDSYPLQQAVIDSDIPGRMMRSLDGVHVSGLGVLADSLLNPVAVEKPLLASKDWRGITFAFYASDLEAAAIRALGARPIDASPDAGESSLRAYDLLEPLYLTANVNLWPQTLAIIGDPDRLTGLSSEQRGWLDQAVRDAAVRSTDLVSVDADALSDLCASGARLATASDADIAGLRDAFAPVVAEAKLDAQTAGFIVEIERLREQTPAGEALTVPDGCTGTTVDPSSDVPTTTTQETPLDGVWEVTYSRDELVAAHPDPSEVEPSNYGHFTLEFHDGDFSFDAAGGRAGRVDLDRLRTPWTATRWSSTWRGTRRRRATTGRRCGGTPGACTGTASRSRRCSGRLPTARLAISLGRCEPTGIVVKPWRRVST